MDQDDINAALAEVQRGNREAYATVVEAIGSQLVGFIVSRCPPQIDPEEIAHEALVEAYRRIDAYALGTSFIAWVQTIARNRLIDACRSLRRRERKVQRLLDESLEYPDSSADQDFDLELQALRRCLPHLDSDLRQALEAVYCQRKDLSETARLVRRSVSQVSRRLAKARALLRACIERQQRPQGRRGGADHDS